MNTQQTTEGNYSLELTFAEMHILLKAMSVYGVKTGYGQYDCINPNESHAAASEKLYDELLECYTRN